MFNTIRRKLIYRKLLRKLKKATKPDKEGNISGKNELRAVLCTLHLINRDPLMEEGYAAQGLLHFEDNYTKGMFAELLKSTKKGNPEAQRKAAVRVLGSMKRPEAESHLKDVVEDITASDELRELAGESLRAMGIEVKIPDYKGKCRVMRRDQFNV